MEAQLEGQEKLQFLGQYSVKNNTRTKKFWPWRGKPHVMFACCAVSVALFIFAVYLIRQNLRLEGRDEMARDIAPASFPTCGNRSTHSCPEGEGCSLSRIRRLVSGLVTSQGSWPWMAEMTFSNKHYCGAVLISKNFVITAAHCLFHHDSRLYEEDIEIRLGSRRKLATDDTTQTRKISDIYIHPAFKLPSLQNDIALLRLHNNVNLTKSVWPICLSGLQSFHGNTNGVMTGWGKTTYKGHFSTLLREATVPIVPFHKCTKVNNGLFDRVSVIKENHICVGYGKDKPEYGCNGDSGGPLMVQSKSGRWLLIGVMSWGEPKCSSRRTSSYTVFTNILPYMSWIESLLKKK